VTKIDESAGKITIKHGSIKKFDIEPMTMVFRAADPVMLKAIKPGDRVRFVPRAHQRPVHDHEDRKSQVKTEPVKAGSQPNVAR
jgi:Cu/Ag efflux protein CusF